MAFGKRFWISGSAPAIGLLALASFNCGQPTALPQVFLWAWERPEDLRFLEGRPDAGVAFLAGTLRLSGSEVLVRPRTQPLALHENTVLAAVARLDVDPDNPPLLDVAQVGKAVRAILSLTDRPGASIVQVDFDATKSQREFYGNLLAELRRGLSPEKLLSITALASWCAGDPWIKGLPVDEAVPMLFQMGPDGPSIRHRLLAGRGFALPICRQAVGLSTDEPWPNSFAVRRIYVFNSVPWSEQTGLGTVTKHGSVR